MDYINSINIMRVLSSGTVGFLSIKSTTMSQYLGSQITISPAYPVGIAIVSNLISSLIIQKTGILREKFFKREAGCLAITVITTVALAVLASCFTGAALGAVLASSALLGLALRISSLVTENLYSLLVIYPYCNKLELYLSNLKLDKNFTSIDQGLHFLNELLPKMIFHSKYTDEARSNRLFLSMDVEGNKKTIKAEYFEGATKGVTANDLNKTATWSCENVLENVEVSNTLLQNNVVEDASRTGLPELISAYTSLIVKVDKEMAILKNLSISSSFVQRLEQLNSHLKKIKKMTLESLICWRIISKNESLGIIYNVADIEEAKKLQNRWNEN